MNRSIILRLVLLGAIWGGSFALQRIAVPEFGTNLVAFGRLAIAAAAMLTVLALTGRALNWRERWRDYAILGAINSAIPFWLFANAAHALPSGYSAVLNATTPMFTVLLTVLAGARPSASKWLGVVVGIVGVGLIAGFGAVPLTVKTVLCFGGGLTAGFLYAVASIDNRKRFAGADPLVVATGTLTASALLLSPLALLDVREATFTLPAGTALLLLGLVCSAAAYAIYFGLLRDAGPERATTVTLLVPVFALGWGALLVGDSVGLIDLAGAALVLFAVTLVFEKIRLPTWRKSEVGEAATSR